MVSVSGRSRGLGRTKESVDSGPGRREIRRESGPGRLRRTWSGGPRGGPGLDTPDPGGPVPGRLLAPRPGRTGRVDVTPRDTETQKDGEVPPFRDPTGGCLSTPPRGVVLRPNLRTRGRDRRPGSKGKLWRRLPRCVDRGGTGFLSLHSTVLREERWRVPDPRGHPRDRPSGFLK